MKAKLKHTRTTPRKAKLVADLIRGRNVGEAMNILTFTRKRVAKTFQKLLKSAIANAEETNQAVDVDALFIKMVRVDKGVTWKRQMSRARGMATTILKRTSHLMIELGEK